MLYTHVYGVIFLFPLYTIQPRSAEEDCNVALTLEPQNVKALYRRALARKVSAHYHDIVFIYFV